MCPTIDRLLYSQIKLIIKLASAIYSTHAFVHAILRVRVLRTDLYCAVEFVSVTETSIEVESRSVEFISAIEA